LDPVKARPLPPQTPPGDGNSTPSALFRFCFFLLVPLTGLSGEYVRAKQLRCHRTRVTATAEERNARLSRPQPVMLPVCTLRSAESTTARTVAPRRGEPHAHARTHTNERTLCARIYDHTHTPTHSWPNPACGFPGDTDEAPAGRSRRTPLRVNNGLQTDHAPRPRPTVASRLQLSARPLTEISLTARSIVTL